MKTKKRQSGKKRGFTIIELLTVMSIIIILIGLLVPAISQVRRYAREVRQKAQFHSISIALDMFEAVYETYPDSGPLGSDGQPYCGAMKLAEALVGQDLLGFHPESTFRSDRMNTAATPKYLYRIPTVGQSDTHVDEVNRKARKGPYISVEKNANAARMSDIYAVADITSMFSGANAEHIFVLTDVYSRTMPSSGEKVGMPILYYRAYKEGTANPNSRGSVVVPFDAANTTRIYRHQDNQDLVELGIPWSAGNSHPLDENYGVAPPAPPGLPESFYYKINNDKMDLQYGMPYRNDSYILLSAGEDGLYGTADDIFNFQK